MFNGGSGDVFQRGEYYIAAQRYAEKLQALLLFFI